MLTRDRYNYSCNRCPPLKVLASNLINISVRLTVLNYPFAFYLLITLKITLICLNNSSSLEL